MVRHQLEIRRLIKGLGLRLESFDQGRTHFRATISNGEIVKKVTFPITPSDPRWYENQKAYLKKIFSNETRNQDEAP